MGVYLFTLAHPAKQNTLLLSYVAKRLQFSWHLETNVLIISHCMLFISSSFTKHLI